jgi:hypothetical protein
MFSVQLRAADDRFGRLRFGVLLGFACPPTGRLDRLHVDVIHSRRRGLCPRPRHPSSGGSRGRRRTSEDLVEGNGQRRMELRQFSITGPAGLLLGLPTLQGASPAYAIAGVVVAVLPRLLPYAYAFLMHRKSKPFTIEDHGVKITGGGNTSST